MLDELAESDTEKIGGLEPGFAGDALNFGQRVRVDLGCDRFHFWCGHGDN